MHSDLFPGVEFGTKGFPFACGGMDSLILLVGSVRQLPSYVGLGN